MVGHKMNDMHIAFDAIVLNYAFEKYLCIS